MTDDMRTVTTCRVCGGHDLREVISFGSVPLANTYPAADTAPGDQPWYPLEVIRCQNCRLVCLRHVVNAEALYRDYFYVTPDARSIDSHMRWVTAECLERYAVPQDSLVVELGSNIGTQLQIFRQAGARVLGVDPAKNLSQVAEHNGVPTIPEFFGDELATTVAREHGNAHVIIGRHVFAHIDDLTDVLAGARTLLHRDGVFVVEVPYLLDLLTKNQFDTIYHEHLSYFSVATLERVFAANGLRLVDVRHADVHGGSILAFAGLPDGKWRATDRVGEFLDLEQDYGLDRDEPYQRFSGRVDRTIQELRSCLRTMSGEGLTVAGYGAPAKGNTLINMCRLGAEEIAFCTDTTEQKQGRLIAGTRIPIRPPDHADLHRPDAYLLLAWNYAKEVVDREFAYLASGGRFVVPIPDVVTVSSTTLVDQFFGVAAGRDTRLAFPA